VDAICLPTFIATSMGNREGQALIAAGAAVDLRIDADDFTLGVEEGAAGIAGIDRHVGLDEGHVGLVRQVACRGRDDAGRRRALEAVWRPDRQHPLADLQPRGIADRHRRQTLGLDAQHGDVGCLIETYDHGRELALVGQLDGDRPGILHDMRVGQDQAVRLKDEARTDTRRRPRVRSIRHAEAAAEIARHLGKGRLVGDLPGRALDAHVHDGAAEACDDGGEIRPGLDRRGRGRIVHAGRQRRRRGPCARRRELDDRRADRAGERCTDKAAFQDCLGHVGSTGRGARVRPLTGTHLGYES
jgi:hypothetical protein